MNWRRVSTIARKDLREVTGSTQVTVPMAIVPVVMCVIMPAVILLAALNLGQAALGNMDFLARLVDPPERDIRAGRYAGAGAPRKP